MDAFVVSQFLSVAANMPFHLFLLNYPNDTQIVISLLAALIVSLPCVVMNCGLLYIHLNLARGKESKPTD